MIYNVWLFYLADRIPECSGGARRFFLKNCKRVSFFCKKPPTIQMAAGKSLYNPQAFGEIP
jgi:hypothetical protein